MDAVNESKKIRLLSIFSQIAVSITNSDRDLDRKVAKGAIRKK